MFYDKGATKERVKYFQNLIIEILHKADLKQEDKSNILEMLKKIQIKLDLLAEEREYIKIKKGQELKQNEDEKHKDRKERNFKKK